MDLDRFLRSLEYTAYNMPNPAWFAMGAAVVLMVALSVDVRRNGARVRTFGGVVGLIGLALLAAYGIAFETYSDATWKSSFELPRVSWWAVAACAFVALGLFGIARNMQRDFQDAQAKVYTSALLVSLASLAWMCMRLPGLPSGEWIDVLALVYGAFEVAALVVVALLLLKSIGRRRSVAKFERAAA